jgi:Flp pilus assembly pilin Flp
MRTLRSALIGLGLGDGTREEHGQDLLEYALLVALIALVAVVAVGSVGRTIHTVFWQAIAGAV